MKRGKGLRGLIAHVPYFHFGGEDAHVRELTNIYEEMGIEPIVFPESRKSPGMNPAVALKSFLSSGEWKSNLQSVLDHGSIDFIHAHNIFPSLGYQFMKWASEVKIPWIQTVHNHRFYCTNGLAFRGGEVCRLCRESSSWFRPIRFNCNHSRLKSAYYSTSLRFLHSRQLYQKVVKTWIAPSPYIVDELVQWGAPKEKVRWIPNPVSIAPLNDLDQEKEFDFFFAGRLSEEKGIFQLIAAAKLLPKFRFGIAGDGPIKEDVLKSIGQMTFKNIKYLGGLSTSEVALKILKSKVCVLPSLCNEILPTFVIEAFCLRRHCVIPDLESTRWLSEGMFPGIKAKTSEPNQLARVLESSLNITDLSEEACLNIREFFGRLTYMKSFKITLQELIKEVEGVS